MILFLHNQIFQQRIKGRLRIFIVGDAFHQLFYASFMLFSSHLWVIFNVDRTCSHICCVIVQDINKWSFVSSSRWHITHQNGPWKDLFMRLEPVGVLFMIMFHMKRQVRGGALSFQIKHHQLSRIVGLCAVRMMGYPSLGVYAPCAAGAQINSSLSSLIRTGDFDNAFVYCLHSWVHSSRMPRIAVDFHACWKIVEFSWSTIWAIVTMPLLLRNAVRSGGSWYKLLHPIQGSTPMRTIEPLQICHVSPLLMVGRVCKTTFQITNIPCLFQDGNRNQSMIFRGQIYL